MIPLSQVLYKNQLHHNEFLYKVCKEYYTVFPIVIYFPKHSFLVESFNRKLERFDCAGLIQYWASAHMDTKYLNFKPEQTGPRELNLDHLSGTIQILIGGWIVSVVVFNIELVWTRILKIKRLAR